jgi:hypothetical protein
MTNNPKDALVQLRFSTYTDEHGYQARVPNPPDVKDKTNKITVGSMLKDNKHMYLGIASFDPIGMKMVKLFEFLAKVVLVQLFFSMCFDDSYLPNTSKSLQSNVFLF